MIPTALPLLLALLPPALSHFTLNSPPARGFNEDQLSQFPCGGQNSPTPRHLIPLPPFPIQLTMGHSTAAVQVLLTLSDPPNSNFNLTLQPTIQETGLGKFCLGAVGMGMGEGGVIKEGMNATVQVVTSGDEGVGAVGGLYSCADITFSSAAQPGACTNGTGVSTVPYTGKAANANGTGAGATASGSASGPAGTPTGTPTRGGAAGIGGVGWWWLVAGVVVGAVGWGVGV